MGQHPLKLYILLKAFKQFNGWISVTLLLGSASNFAIDRVTETESLNITAVSNDPIL
jgi:hypothetical protein